MSQLVKRFGLPEDADLKPYYDTKEIVQDTEILNFFPATASRDSNRDNYVSNPFPGDEWRLIYGLSIELTKQTIQTATGIDPIKIVNALKDAAIIITADQDNKEFIREPLSHYMNFQGTGLNTRLGYAADPAAADDDTSEEHTVILKSTGEKRLSDPFYIAPTQIVTVQILFEDGSNFPTGTEWDNASQPRLELKTTLQVAELASKPAAA